MLLNPKTVLSHKLLADLVILNANVITVDDKNPKAEAFAVKYEKICISQHDD